ncbi:MAG: NAD(+) synthase [Deltaproteobacteria bacterium]|nr:MAG: NAD(+) synthase [Deltaproteobacteria bacterium]
MKLIKVGAAVLNQTPLAWEHNKTNILDALGRARAEGTTLVCLPEMAITGYGCQDAFHSPSVQAMALDVLFDEILPATTGLVVSIGLPLLYRNSLFNAAALVVDGEVAGFVCKRYLAGDGVHYEPRWFKPWELGARGHVDIRGRRYPVGDLYFEVGGVKIGFEICEDAWVATRPGSSMAGRGVDIILNPSASHFAFDKIDVRKRFVIEGSRAFGVTYVYANLLGNDSGRIVYDGGALIATTGRMVVEGRRFGYDLVDLTSAVVDVEQSRMIQTWTNSFRPRFDEPADECAIVPFTWPARPLELPTSAGTEPWERSPHKKEEEFTRAVSLSLFDYLRRSWSRGFVISLSGGADSTACACLVAQMCELAVGDLGLDGVKERLRYIPQLAGAESARDLVSGLLLCVYQATRNSSDVTRNAARDVADALGAEFMSLDVDALVAGYTQMVEQAIGRELTWATDDLALQNIQARVRAPGVWMLANLRGALLVSTSNRSEAAVGYATMDGDTAGGISPIAGIDKAFLRRWLRWVEAEGPAGLGPIPAVRAVNVQQPTAELRPLERAQTDEADLMPYPLLDAIEGAAIRDKQDPLETFLLMRVHFPDIPPRQLALWVERFFTLWCRNQWKRERYAPSFHVDDKNLDPKTWCRFPILSGGFTRELAVLRAYVADHFPGA